MSAPIGVGRAFPLALLTLVLLSWAPVVAAEAGDGTIDLPCEPRERFTACFNRLSGTTLGWTAIEAGRAAAEDQWDRVIADAISAMLQDTLTGSASGTSTVEDLSQRLIVELPDLADGVPIEGEAEDADGRLDLRLNLPLCPGGPRFGNCTRLSASIARDPEPSAALLETVPEAEREAVGAVLEARLDPGDDVTWSLTYAFEGRFGGWRVGRGAGGYVEDFRSLHARLARGRLRELLSGQDLIRDLSEDARDPLTRTERDQVIGRPFADLPEALRTRLAVRAREALRRVDPAVTDPVELEAMRVLIANQPQLLFEASRRERDPRVGADETRWSVRFEQPLGDNWNRLGDRVRKACADADGGAGGGPQACLDVLGSVGKTGSGARSWANSLRASFSVAFVDRSAVDLTLADPALAFRAPASTTWVVEAGLGRNFEGRGILSRSRLDLMASYESTDEESRGGAAVPPRNDRALATLTWTLTYKGAKVPLELVYASRPEFDLTDVEEQLSARFGLRWDFEDLWPGGNEDD